MPRLLLALLLLAPLAAAQPAEDDAPRPELSVAQIMQDPKTWIGPWPDDVHWRDDGEHVYFSWNPGGEALADSLYRIPRGGGEPERVPAAEALRLPPRFEGWHADRLAYGPDFGQRVFERGGDLYLYDLGAGALRRLTRTPQREERPRFAPPGPARPGARRVVYVAGDNVFALDLGGGAIEQLTDLRAGDAPEDAEPTPAERFLERQQEALFGVLRRQGEEEAAREAARERLRRATGVPSALHYGDGTVGQLQVDPTERFVTFAVTRDAKARPTTMTDYVTRSGQAEALTDRPKVGFPDDPVAFYVHDRQRDTTFALDFWQLPGAADAPDYARARGAERDTTRQFLAFGPHWSPDGRYAVLDVRTRDNKDRWLARLYPETGVLTAFDRQRDEAWVAGPGIAWYPERSPVGWLPDGRTFWFQSEASGWSHLWTVDAETGERRQLTSGPFEVEDVRLSRDGRTWTFQSSEASPYERHLYAMPVGGGARTRLTHLPGRTDGAPSPDGAWLALLQSESNRPPEVWVQPLRGEPEQVTVSTTAAWQDYPWREAEIVTIPASDGAAVPARIYRPDTPNGAAVLFVHGSGWLQNAHRWWSSYFREYQFHNLLADLGYTVLDLDFRGSAGHGRAWRTAVYRHMGGRDLQDYVDASRWLGDSLGVPPERVAIYGGSYGGFITLMALFTEPEHFGGGAALRAVTDWAHYNALYAGNILNTPAADSLAYARSSPIYFAEGLEDPLLICHGLIDTNVQPQDVFRLAQRLIELGKEDWELALYPVEAHSFTEPTSWADEYRRVLELIESSVGPGRGADPDEG